MASPSKFLTPSLIHRGEEIYPEEPTNLLQPTSTSFLDASHWTRIHNVGNVFLWYSKNVSTASGLIINIISKFFASQKILAFTTDCAYRNFPNWSFIFILSFRRRLSSTKVGRYLCFFIHSNPANSLEAATCTCRLNCECENWSRGGHPNITSTQIPTTTLLSLLASLQN